MKTLSSLLFALCATTTITAAHAAATKCVQLGGTFTAGNAPVTNSMEWYLATKCKFNGVAVDVHGVSSISSGTAPSAVGAVYSGTPAASSVSSTNSGYCWCKMIYPAVSKWIAPSTSTMSYAGCANVCPGAFNTNATFRNAMISNLLY